MASGSFDHTAVDALNLDARRAHMNAFFMHLGVWDSARVAKAREKCVEMFCQLLDTRGHLSVNHEYFEYEVDALVWFNILKRGKVLTEATKWPWSETIPEIADSTAQVSATYRDWLRRKWDINGEGNTQESSNSEEQKVSAAPVVGESFKEAMPRFG
ncbi:uncharacterized protein FSUBG_14115 [Fusarium subglutinans]|uniref:Uncharacterized protein n=1 Tax=Gibberella subglutinans TaxID=42677 RepID=A0A8H5KIW1_GIBSU|nr:uncharacterized protein FSUBG_14115 [Fusarium subglutinans]KAF5573251.1 hypothetical protein FSUBG_14115 [Fusarium subglutinans]